MIFKTIFDFFMHLDVNLALLIQTYGIIIYPLLFFIIFAETGLVITPILPGDSLIFAAGALAAIGSMNIIILFLILALAAVLGDTVNYWIGHYLGPRVFKHENKYFKQEYLLRTKAFYDKHGGKTIILARFVPIIRTFAPFVAGVGRMRYLRFISFNIIGGLAWVALFLFGGYFFGNLQFVRTNFSLFILGIIIVSVMPLVWSLIREKMRSKKNFNC